MTDALFEIPDSERVPAAPAEQLTRGQRRQRLVDARIAASTHPLGYLPLHPQAAHGRDGDGLRCGSCRWRVTIRHHDRTYPKCHYPDHLGRHPRDTACESSDVRAWWPACHDHEEDPT
ncbi:hypothetical protein QLQ77_gp53 [Gordonia phage Reyja]|uniref:Uncharacterized protein n=1 Tax=Gordonia phage Reyja TaxID=2571250 RepID=A0A4D6T6V3_9CAUD|nr:hypothetical protein QLQ77_gp53 [Gordonia phage Reyja]QCG77799.1 hypothetical protein SEA_REYJA_53 [Gordonia phage Reyja]